MAYTQSNRPIGVTTPLGQDVLLLRRAVIKEGLGRLFEIELELLSEDAEIAAESLLGQPVTVRMGVAEGEQRFFNGYVSRFGPVDWQRQDLFLYRASLVPVALFLTQTSDCRLFHQKTVPEIVKSVFQEAGVQVRDLLQSTYPKRDCCAQYRETHFNFACRLMEQEGIYWYFDHDEGVHTLVLVDSYSGHSSYPGYDEIRYHPEGQAIAWDEDFIFALIQSTAVRPGAFVHKDFDFEKPKVDLVSNSVNDLGHAHSSYEIYDYPGEYTELGEGDRYARIRLEALQVGHQVVEGKGRARGVAAGHLFSVTEHPRSELNKEYLVLEARHQIQTDEFESTSSASQGPIYESQFKLMDSKTPFRPPRVTPRPIVRGPQTAIVVGEGEIDTDKYSRVKVRFHWDRNRDSSCWVRVSQLWAGAQWGGIHIPRVGQEVIVDFLEGDPDRPVITGRVYNADCMPPYALPANKTQSGIKSRSSEGGGADNFNELRFEDEKGQEEVYLHAERNLKTTVEASESRSVGGSRSTVIQKDDTLKIKEGDRTATLDQGSDTLTVSLGDITIEAPTGTFSVSAKDVDISGTVSVTIRCGASSIRMTPDSIQISAPNVQVSGSIMTTVQGTMVKINC